jgi:hypothetical protein
MPFTFTLAHKLVFGTILLGVLCGVSWIHGYSTAGARLQRTAEKEYAKALEEAKKQGEQDKKIAEQAQRKLTQKESQLNEILNREIPSDPDCALDGERLQQLQDLASSTATD